MQKDKKRPKTEKQLSREQLGEAYAYLKYTIFEQIREVYRSAYKQTGITQQAIADKLGVDKALISKRLHGDENLTLKTISELLTAMNARLDVKGVLLSEVKAVQDDAVCVGVVDLAENVSFSGESYRRVLVSSKAGRGWVISREEECWVGMGNVYEFGKTVNDESVQPEGARKFAQTLNMQTVLQ